MLRRCPFLASGEDEALFHDGGFFRPVDDLAFQLEGLHEWQFTAEADGGMVGQWSPLVAEDGLAQLGAAHMIHTAKIHHGQIAAVGEVDVHINIGGKNAQAHNRLAEHIC